MTEPNVQDQLRDIQVKLDKISDEMAQRTRRQEEMNELNADLTVVAKDMFQTAVVELEDVAPFVQTGDFLHLVKRILRNTNAISDAISKFESTLDFVDDAQPIGKELFCDVLHKLDDLDQRGYFEFARALMETLDLVVKQVSPEDVKKFAQNIPTLVEILKLLADTKLLMALKETMQTLSEADAAHFDGYSPWRIYKETRAPEVRRALGFAVMFLKTFMQNNNHLSKKGRK